MAAPLLSWTVIAAITGGVPAWGSTTRHRITGDLRASSGTAAGELALLGLVAMALRHCPCGRDIQVAPPREPEASIGRVDVYL